MVLVSHDDGSTELLTVQDTSSPLISTFDGREGDGETMICPLEIETLPNTPSPCPTSPVDSQAEDAMTRTVEVVEVEEEEENVVRAEQWSDCDSPGRGDDSQSLPATPASAVSQSQSDCEAHQVRQQLLIVKF